MDAALVKSLETLTSRDRLQRYRLAGISDLETATLYLWNIELTGALLPSIAILEVSLRNAVHTALSKKAGTDFWFQSQLQPKRWQNVQDIMTKLQNPTAGKVIAELTFGFWPHIFADAYKHIWWNPPNTLLEEVIPNRQPLQPSDRKILMHRLFYFNNLRNRAMHHEPIFQGVASVNKPVLPIEELHRQLVETIGWISADAGKVLSCVDRFDDVFSAAGRRDLERTIKHRFNIP